MHPGCAIQLSFKMLLDAALDKPEKGESGNLPHEPVSAGAWITSPSTASHFIQGQDLLQVDVPPAAGEFCFVDDSTALASLPELFQNDEAFIVCLNTSGRLQFVRDFGMRGYAATASPAFYGDFLSKLRAAASKTGFRFLEVIAPCPSIWKSEPSNTVEIARLAVAVGLWPLFEIDQGRVTVSHKPERLVPKTAFEAMQGLVRVDESALEKEWKKFLVKPFEAAI